MINRLIEPMFAWSRGPKIAIQVVLDFFLFNLSFVMAMYLRLDSWSFLNLTDTLLLGLACSVIAIIVMGAVGVYHSVIRYLSNRIVPLIFWCILGAAALLLIASQVLGVFLPRSVPAIYVMLAFLAMTSVRYTARYIYLMQQKRSHLPVIIYGAGQSGRQLLASLLRGHLFRPVAFVDDNQSMRGQIIEGVGIVTPDQLPRIIEKHDAKIILLAMPSVPLRRRNEIIRALEPLQLQIQTIPAMEDLVSGRASISDFRQVSIEDLLGREPVQPQPELMARNIAGKTVMVTGAGGSIGSELCRQILRQRPACVVLFEQSEFALYEIEQELSEVIWRKRSGVRIVPVLGDILDAARVAAAVREHGVKTIFHAAAYKHVPLVEQNIVEGIRNNVNGTRIVAAAAVAAGVDAFIFVSTDKAVRPTNFMGASKRIAELVCQSAAAEQNRTCFSIVRFGNVLGSSGSVVPLFQQQIKRGGPLTITHPDVTRYFMTIPEAAQLVIQAGAMAEGGEVFVLDMGEPIRIADLAAKMIRLSGFRPIYGEATPDKESIQIVYTGLRPGEKLFEELLVGDEALGTDHPRIMKANERALPKAELTRVLATIDEAISRNDKAALRTVIERLDIGFRHEANADGGLLRALE